jgi:hypothetical protein
VSILEINNSSNQTSTHTRHVVKTKRVGEVYYSDQGRVPSTTDLVFRTNRKIITTYRAMCPSEFRPVLPLDLGTNRLAHGAADAVLVDSTVRVSHTGARSGSDCSHHKFAKNKQWFSDWVMRL